MAGTGCAAGVGLTATAIPARADSSRPNARPAAERDLIRAAEDEGGIMQVRKIVSCLEETRSDGARVVMPATRKAVAAAVIANPCARGGDDALGALVEAGGELGALLVRRALTALAVS